MSLELAALQILRMKGRTTLGVVSAVTRMSEREAQDTLSSLGQAGHCQEDAGRYRITNIGRERLAQLLYAERQSLDQRAIERLYESFTPINSEYKAIIHRWQIRGETPNDHSDSQYDHDVLRDVYAIHAQLELILSAVVSIAPRLAPFSSRFTESLTKVRNGDVRWLTRPIIESHHTVWFEFHEELIGLAGLTRAAEAAGGRAA